MINKVLTPGVILFTLFFTNVNAEPVAIQDNTPILGRWKVVFTAPNLEKEKKPTTEKWEFKQDGTFILLAKDRRANSELQTKTRYTVENGTIKVENPGRPGKFMVYRVHDKSDNNMILQGGLEGFYFLKKM